MTTAFETPTAAETAAPRPLSPTGTQLAAVLSTLAVLFKVRIVGLLLLAGTGGAFLAAGGWPGWKALALMALTGGVAAMGAAALNQYLEQAEDGTMRRTQRRPLVTGTIARPAWVPIVGLAMIFLPALAVLPTYPALAFWSLAGAAVYVGVYTVWLKPRTVLNIVIGGLAGTCAVLSGSAAAGNWAQPGALALGLLVFLWTPTHFWSLAIMYREDYARVNLPMLPARASVRRSALWVLLHGAATGFAALALTGDAVLGGWYLLAAAPVTGYLLWNCLALVVKPLPARARSAFMASNIFLALILVLICLNAVI